MPLSTTGRYGVRMMLDLALNHETGHILMQGYCQKAGDLGEILGAVGSSYQGSGTAKDPQVCKRVIQLS